MPVPASFNDVTADPAVRDHVGDVWYQTMVRVPRGWDGQRVVLHFESATHRATAWVNDAEVVSHEGGYTPFEAEVTDLVQAGDEARITVVVNNTLSWQSIPPGVVEDTPDGKRLRYFHDFFNYAGIHRPVWLYATGRAHLTDVTVVTGLAGANGSIEYRTEAGRTPTAPRSGWCCATPTGPRSPPAGAPAAALTVDERPPVGTGRRLPVRPRGPAGRRRRRAPGQLPPERGRAHRGRGRHHGSSSTASRSTSPASASMRTWP